MPNAAWRAKWGLIKDEPRHPIGGLPDGVSVEEPPFLELSNAFGSVSPIQAPMLSRRGSLGAISHPGRMSSTPTAAVCCC